MKVRLGRGDPVFSLRKKALPAHVAGRECDPTDMDFRLSPDGSSEIDLGNVDRRGDVGATRSGRQYERATFTARAQHHYRRRQAFVQFHPAVAVANIWLTAHPKTLDILIKPIVDGATGLHGHRLAAFLKSIIRVTYKHPKEIPLHDATLAPTPLLSDPTHLPAATACGQGLTNLTFVADGFICVPSLITEIPLDDPPASTSGKLTFLDK
jgi:hypothetical protein